MRNKIIEWAQMFDTLQDAADSIDVSKSSVSCWLRGVRRPSLVQCLKIQKTTNNAICVEDLRPDLLKKIGE